MRSAARGLEIPVLLASEEMAGTYSVLSRYLFDRREDLRLPTALLIDGRGDIAKVYRDRVAADEVVADASRTSAVPGRAAGARRALPRHVPHRSRRAQLLPVQPRPGRAGVRGGRPRRLRAGGEARPERDHLLQPRDPLHEGGPPRAGAGGLRARAHPPAGVPRGQQQPGRAPGPERRAAGRGRPVPPGPRGAGPTSPTPSTTSASRSSSRARTRRRTSSSRRRSRCSPSSRRPSTTSASSSASRATSSARRRTSGRPWRSVPATARPPTTSPWSSPRRATPAPRSRPCSA